jgi:hypothetical protein
MQGEEVMGVIVQPAPVKLFAGMITSMPEIVPEVENQLAALCGPIDLRSEAFPFDYTSYYDREMGTPLFRFFIAFRDLTSPAELAPLKKRTNQFEALAAGQYAQVRRPVNIDPGYVEQAKIVLASTKNFYHRIFLADGIYAEVTMHFEAGQWRSFPWSFPDFRSGRYDRYFIELRHIYRAQLKSPNR